MATWTASGVLLHSTGRPAQICGMVGSSIVERLRYVDSAGEAVDLTGWTLLARCELYRGEWSEDDRLVSLLPQMLASAVAGVTVAAEDQAAAPGVFRLAVPPTLPPVEHRDVRIGARLLPTLACWIKLTAPARDATIDQARVAVGWRRGAGSA